MKLLILVRHAKTERLYHGITDFQRSLTKNRGKKDSVLISNVLLKNDIIPDMIISSPANRAIETAQIFARELNYPVERISVKDLLYDYFTTNDILNMLYSVNNNLDKVLIVGHNPSIADLGDRFTNGFHSHLPTTGALGIEFDVNNWSEIEVGKGMLRFFEYPSKYK